MLAIADYQIAEQIEAGANTVIYRGYKEPAKQPVIIKTLKTNYPSLEQLTRLKHEYEITQELDIAGVVKSYRIENYQNSLALILEDMGGTSLKQLIKARRLHLREALEIAIKLADTINELHKNQIIHKDIKPSNIIINESTGEVKITDFSIASRLTTENQTGGNPNWLEGTLAYMSPEQTGRMNRSIDYRSDFYSLGVTLYEMLTGELPFETTDPLELVHCHIAKTPVPPHVRAGGPRQYPEVPEAVSDIVMKLLAKTAEERYQSALGLKADLEICLNKLSATGKIEKFPLGMRDKSGQLLIPQKLYGRDREVDTLMSAFERVKAANPRPTTEMMLVAGYSGIGKSALVNEIHKPIVGARGYFISGKFDQYKRNIPYSSLIQAFQSLMRQLLTESCEKIESWKQKLLDAIGPNGSVIIDVIPEVELIVGKQPPVPQLGPTESQNRFNRVFQQFIHVFCQKEHPLVVFLDDLQWADSASLKLIQLLITDPDSQYLLLIGAYRDNEVSATHPLMLTLEEIQKTGAIVNAIALGPLELEHVNQLIAETLSCDSETRFLGETGFLEPRTKPLSELVRNKTAGNPFFLTQLLKSLQCENLLVYNVGTGCWEWDIEQIQAVGITDNVVELMVSQIQKLPQTTQNVLKLAACIGNWFNLDVLAIVNEKSLVATAKELWSALQRGLILPYNSDYKIPLVFDSDELEEIVSELRVDYKFLHDRVQQAAYALIPESQKKEVHQKVGQLLLKNMDEDARSENLFDIVNHLNIGADLIANQEEKDELASLNLATGQRAKVATAYEAALRYLNVGMGLLASNSWTHQYDLTLALYVETVEAEFLNTNFERSESLGEVVLQQATTLLDSVKVYEVKMLIYIAQLQTLKALDIGLKALERLGVSLIGLGEDGHGLVELPSQTDLEDIPEMTAPDKLAAMRLLMTLVPPTYQTKPEFLPPVVLTMVNLSLKYGHSGLAAYAYAMYSIILCGIQGDPSAGYYAGQLAIRLQEKFGVRELKCKVYTLFNYHIRPWKEHPREAIAPLLEAFQSGLETGDLEYASYAAMFYCDYLFFMGENLSFVVQKQAPYVDILQKLKQESPVYYGKIYRQLGLNLQGLASDKYLLIGESFDEAEMLPRMRNTNNHTSLFPAYLAKTILFYLFKDYPQAVANARLAAEHAVGAIGSMTVAEHNFYYSLALLAHYPSADFSSQEQILCQVAANQEKMQHWAYHAPANFQHKYSLVLAEKARVLGQNWEAMELYDKAIAGARKEGYIQEEALAYELAAEFYLAKGREEIAQTYITKAHYGYIRWGATAKVQDLEARYPQFLSQTPNRETTHIDVKTTTSTAGANGAVLDFATVMKASQAIAGEIVLGNLLDKLMKIVIENAGAQTGLLILQNDRHLAIYAAGAVDKDEVVIWEQTPAVTSHDLPVSVINYVVRTQENVVLNDATESGIFATDTYIIKNQPKSVLCTPLIHQGKFIGLLYLENNLTTGAFTTEKLEVLKILSCQVAISLENARLYANLSALTENLKVANEQLEDYSRTLEVKVSERTLELREKNWRLKEQATQLEQALQEVQATQAQLIQTEKMSSLGQLVAGVAHEINNPVNFIYGNLTHAGEYIKNLLHLIALYEQEYPNPTPALVAATEDIELEFLIEDLPKLLSSMKIGAERIREIVLSLRNFSRLDEAEMKPVDIHDGLDSTLLILQHRLKEKAESSTISVIKEYGDLPKVECYAGQLNQVFMNVLNNAIDALEEQGSRGALEQRSRGALEIRIRTEVINGDRVAIRIADNGPGMTEEVQKHLFDPFFTTKPVGKGTGLGLSISYQIVGEKHWGKLSCVSAPGAGAEFIIEIPIKQLITRK